MYSFHIKKEKKLIEKLNRSIKQIQYNKFLWKDWIKIYNKRNTLYIHIFIECNRTLLEDRFDNDQNRYKSCLHFV